VLEFLREKIIFDFFVFLNFFEFLDTFLEFL